MSRPRLRFTDAPRAPIRWGALAVFCCLTAYGVTTMAVPVQVMAWACAGALIAVQLLRRPVTRLRLDDRGLSVRQGRGLNRQFAKADIAALHHLPDRHGPGMIHVELDNGRIETLPLLTLPPRATLARAASAHGLPFVAH